MSNNAALNGNTATASENAATTGAPTAAPTSAPTGAAFATQIAAALTEAAAGPAPTDYSNPANWHLCPTGTQLTHGVDVIFLIPSSCMTPESGLVCAVDDASLLQVGATHYAQQAACFEGVANIYFPWWRQVNAALLPALSFEQVDRLEHGAPKADVFAALDFYFEHLNAGRPYFLAGHSQGSRLISLVLAEYMRAHPQRYSRMICAYMLGDGLTRNFLAANPHVKAAKSATDLGVVASWNTEGPANIGAASLVVPEGCVCINPLNWRTDETYAPAELNLGCVIPDPATGGVHKLPGMADAQVNLERGTVIVPEPACQQFSITAAAGQEFAAVFGPQSYHGCDYGFFFHNIRENARARADAWQQSHQ